MSETPHHLRFRADERREVALAASIALPEQASGQVRVTAGVLNRFSRIDGTLMDISSGGAGLVIGEYVPKWSPVILGVHRTSEAEGALVRARGIVRRVQMLDRRPSYLIGVGFEEMDAQTAADLETLLAEIDGVSVASGGGGAGGA